MGTDTDTETWASLDFGLHRRSWVQYQGMAVVQNYSFSPQKYNSYLSSILILWDWVCVILTGIINFQVVFVFFLKHSMAF